MSGNPRFRIAMLLAATEMAMALAVRGVVIGAWWPLAVAALALALNVPLAIWVAQRYGHAWFYNALAMEPEFQGWRRPVWRGSDDWPGDETDTYWRRTIVLRIPGRRYLVVAIPIRRKHS